MLELKGLAASSPICFMAALGLLRVLAEDLQQDVRLFWSNGHAVLDGVGDQEELLSLLVAHMKERHQAPEWNWQPTAKQVSAAHYGETCRLWRESPRALGFLAAFGTDTVLNDDGSIRSSRLDLTSGRQQLLSDLRKLAMELATPKNAETSFTTALFGGLYQDQSTFGWDPATIKKHAHEYKAPTRLKPKGKKGQVWLAAEALPLHPVIPVNGRAQTTGCEHIEGQGHYFWPIWGNPYLLGLNEVRFLRALGFKGVLRRMEVTELWGAEFDKSGKCGILLPGRRIR